MVVNIDSTVAAVAKAVEEAEHMAGVEITQVYAGIAGSHIKAFHSEGVVAIRDREVRPGDIERVIEAAKAVSIPQDREILHVVPREFSIDQQDGIKEPLGMAGVRLEAKVHIVTAACASAQNIIKCCTRCGLEVQDSGAGTVCDGGISAAQRRKELEWRCSTSAAEPVIWSSFPKARSSTPSCCRLAGTSLQTTLRSGCARR